MKEKVNFIFRKLLDTSSIKFSDSAVKESNHPAQKDGTYDNRSTPCTNQPRAFTRRGTRRRRGVRSGGGIRRLDHSNSNVGRVSAGTSREGGRSAAESDICTLGSMSAQLGRLRINS